MTKHDTNSIMSSTNTSTSTSGTASITDSATDKNNTMNNERKIIQTLFEASLNGNYNAVATTIVQYIQDYNSSSSNTASTTTNNNNNNNNNEKNKITLSDVLLQFKDATKRTIFHYACQSKVVAVSNMNIDSNCSSNRSNILVVDTRINTNDIVTKLLYSNEINELLQQSNDNNNDNDNDNDNDNCIQTMIRLKDSNGLTPLMIVCQQLSSVSSSVSTSSNNDNDINDTTYDITISISRIVSLLTKANASTSKGGTNSSSKLTLARSKIGSTALHYSCCSDVASWSPSTPSTPSTPSDSTDSATGIGTSSTSTSTGTSSSIKTNNNTNTTTTNNNTSTNNSYNIIQLLLNDSIIPLTTFSINGGTPLHWSCSMTSIVSIHCNTIHTLLVEYHRRIYIVSCSTNTNTNTNVSVSTSSTNACTKLTPTQHLLNMYNTTIPPAFVVCIAAHHTQHAIQLIQTSIYLSTLHTNTCTVSTTTTGSTSTNDSTTGTTNDSTANEQSSELLLLPSLQYKLITNPNTNEYTYAIHMICEQNMDQLLMELLQSFFSSIISTTSTSTGSIDTTDSTGNTTTNANISDEQFNTVNELLFTTQDSNGYIPIHVAAYEQHIQCVQLLLPYYYQYYSNHYDSTSDNDNDNNNNNNSTTTGSIQNVTNPNTYTVSAQQYIETFHQQLKQKNTIPTTSNTNINGNNNGNITDTDLSNKINTNSTNDDTTTSSTSAITNTNNDSNNNMSTILSSSIAILSKISIIEKEAQKYISYIQLQQPHSKSNTTSNNNNNNNNDENDSSTMQQQTKESENRIITTKDETQTQTQLQTALDYKNLGNIQFSNKNYTTAIQYYTKAIQLDPIQLTYYSNRSTCYILLQSLLSESSLSSKVETDTTDGTIATTSITSTTDSTTTIEQQQSSTTAPPVVEDNVIDTTNNNNDNNYVHYYNTLSLLEKSFYDAIATHALDPKWYKSYYRISIALYELQYYEDAAVNAWEAMQLLTSSITADNVTTTKNDTIVLNELKALLQKCVKQGRTDYQEKSKK